MTILIVLIGLLISHFATGFRHWRSFAWLMWPLEQIRGRLPYRPWLLFVLVLGASLLSAWLATWLATGLLGVVGWALLALAAFIYTLGPRDLDFDIRILLQRDQAESQEAVDRVMQAMQLSAGDSAAETSSAILHAALSRWFGILFWFIVLGIPGAVLYRFTRIALQREDLRPGEVEWLARLRLVLDWPVLALMLLSVALCGDLDRVHGAWKARRGTSPAWLLSPSLIDQVSAAIAPPEGGFDEGLMLGHQMIWRMLVLWLAALSLALLAGWLV